MLFFLGVQISEILSSCWSTELQYLLFIVMELLALPRNPSFQPYWARSFRDLQDHFLPAITPIPQPLPSLLCPSHFELSSSELTAPPRGQWFPNIIVTQIRRSPNRACISNKFPWVMRLLVQNFTLRTFTLAYQSFAEKKPSLFYLVSVTPSTVVQQTSSVPLANLYGDKNVELVLKHQKSPS